MNRAVIVAVVAVSALVAGAGGGGDDRSEAAPTRTVNVEMVDIAFRPATVAVEAGERIRFVFRNQGNAVHDAFIGDASAQADHEREMRQAEKDGDHGGGHRDDDANRDAITVNPGKKAELTYTFARAGTVEIGCHQPGHYAAGMKLPVTVTCRSPASESSPPSAASLPVSPPSELRNPLNSAPERPSYDGSR